MNLVRRRRNHRVTSKPCTSVTNSIAGCLRRRRPRTHEGHWCSAAIARQKSALRNHPNSVILSAAGWSAGKSSGGVEGPAAIV